MSNGGMTDDEFAEYYDTGKVRPRGNLKRQPNHIPPYDLKDTTIRAIWKRVRAKLGRDPQPREIEAVVTIMFRAHWGELITPTELNRQMGLKKGREANNLSGNLSKLRTIVFEEIGAVKTYSGGNNGRWGWPS